MKRFVFVLCLLASTALAEGYADISDEEVREVERKARIERKEQDIRDDLWRTIRDHLDALPPEATAEEEATLVMSLIRGYLYDQLQSRDRGYTDDELRAYNKVRRIKDKSKSGTSIRQRYRNPKKSLDSYWEPSPPTEKP